MCTTALCQLKAPITFHFFADCFIAWMDAFRKKNIKKAADAPKHDVLIVFEMYAPGVGPAPRFAVLSAFSGAFGNIAATFTFHEVAPVTVLTTAGNYAGTLLQLQYLERITSRFAAACRLTSAFEWLLQCLNI